MFTSYLSFSQSCGNEADALDINRLIKNRNSSNKNTVKKNQSIKYIPIRFHIVSETNGNGGISEYNIIKEIYSLNQIYKNTDFVFYIKDNHFNYVKNTNLYNTPLNSESSSTIQSEINKSGKDCINVFITNKADSDGSGTTLGYYDHYEDVIVIKKSQINGTKSTLAHEIGHYFSLLHTFNGWDSEPYNKSTHGNPVFSQLSPGGVVNELASGNNCAESGDYICDTPGDYNFGFGWSGCNPYTKEIKDYEGDIMDPDETNLMGYFLGCSTYNITENQMAAMYADYETDDREYISSEHIPNQVKLGYATLNEPINESIVDEYNYINLDWSDVSDSERYLVRITRGVFSNYYFTTNSELTVTDLSPNETYRWTVLPYNETGGGSEFSEEYSFKTGTISNIKNIKRINLTIHPTILNHDDQLTIYIEEHSEAMLNIYNVSGYKFLDKTIFLQSGRNQLDIPSLTPGIYFLQVNFDKYSETFKLIKS